MSGSSAEDRVRARIDAAIVKQPARAAACPTCGSPIGSPCKRPSGYVIPGGGVHADRFRLVSGFLGARELDMPTAPEGVRRV